MKPGGWILIEEMVPPITEALSRSDDPDVQLAHKARQAIVEVICRNGGDLTFAREIPRILGEGGVGDIGVEGFFLPFRTDAVADLAQGEHRPTERTLVESGLVSRGGTGSLPHAAR